MGFLPVVASVAFPIMIAVVVNVIVYTRGIAGNNSEPRNSLLPPGYVIAGIWIVLFGLLGYVAYRVRSSLIAIISILLLLALCIAYPFITALDNKRGVIVNTITMAVAFSVAIIVGVHDLPSIYIMTPLLIWSSYVNIIDSIGYAKIL